MKNKLIIITLIAFLSLGWGHTNASVDEQKCSNTLILTQTKTGQEIKDEKLCCWSDIVVGLESTDILASYNTPVVLIPSPGPGKFIQVTSAQFHYTFGGTEFHGDSLHYDGRELSIKFPSSHTLWGPSGYWYAKNGIDAPMSGTMPFMLGTNAGDIIIPNEPLIFTTDNQLYDGDGKITILITYRIMDVFW